MWSPAAVLEMKSQGFMAAHIPAEAKKALPVLAVITTGADNFLRVACKHFKQMPLPKIMVPLCLVPALALKLCTEIQPGKGCQCQTVPEKRSYFQPGAVPWAGSPQPCVQGRDKWLWQGWPAASFGVSMAWVGLRLVFSPEI